MVEFLRILPEGTWDWVDQNNQEAYISYQNGIEKLIIKVDFTKEFSEAIWIIPIPTKPENVKVDIVSSLPRFYGWELTKKTTWTLREPAISLLYPSILYPIFYHLGFCIGAIDGSEGEGKKGDVTIYYSFGKSGNGY